MNLEAVLKSRAEESCELCHSTDELRVYGVPPEESTAPENNILVCTKCDAQLQKKEQLDAAHWKILSETMWSEIPAVQVVAWRMLNRLQHESWAADNLDILYLSEEDLAWAKKTGDHENDGFVQFHVDSLGAQLAEGDTVVLTKTLDVKGSTIKATLGTVVKNIHLVHDNTEQIEGKVEGQTIVILTKYLRKNNA
ncbi:PhnA domain-containing protein [Sphingobacteriaceae bacterium WQ 2009]|uniref:PhnA domain-containing protein n=1 Tax=Rhinopithecimicrobium faecis TaxID=2820698 RepID=A0A8T4HC76_9SPHI|nr:PhnA domain-containing protein [Sphingobacteriaceae bacterium WQ 2009]